MTSWRHVFHFLSLPIISLPRSLPGRRWARVYPWTCKRSLSTSGARHEIDHAWRSRCRSTSRLWRHHLIDGQAFCVWCPHQTNRLFLKSADEASCPLALINFKFPLQPRHTVWRTWLFIACSEQTWKARNVTYRFLSDNQAFHCTRWRSPPSSLKPPTPKSDQFQISPAASPEILYHTVWRTWLFMAYAERWLYYQFSLHHLYISLQTVGRMYFLNSLGVGVKGLNH